MKIQSGEEGGELKSVKWPYKIKPYWKKNSDGGVEFLWVLQIQIPGINGISSVQAQKSEVGVRVDSSQPVNEQTIYVGLKSVNDRLLVTLKDNSHLDVSLQLLFPKPIIIEQDCEELNLKLSPKVKSSAIGPENPEMNQSNSEDAAASAAGAVENSSNIDNNKPLIEKKVVPFYLAYKCEATSIGINLAVTAPMEMAWFSNSIFESKGKGKNWKNFDIGVQINTFLKQEIGTIEFEWNNNRYPFQILVERTQIIRPISAFIFSLGLFNFSIKTLTDEKDVAKPAANVSFEIRPLDLNFSLGGQGLTSIPSLDAKSYFNHTETFGYLGYTLISRKNWYFEPRGYLYIINGVIKLLNYFYITSDAAIGGITRYNLSLRDQLSLEFFVSGSKNQNSVTVQAMYSRKSRNLVGGWGIVCNYKSISMNLKTDEESQGRQIYLGPYLEF